MASKGIKINLACFIMNKMIRVLKERKRSKRKKILKETTSFNAIHHTHNPLCQVLGNLSPKYEMVPFAVKYNLASIAKMGYRDHNNDGIFVKIRGVVDDDDDGEKLALAT